MVTVDGVVPLAFAWSPRHVLVLPEELVAAAALGAVGTVTSPGLVIGTDLTVHAEDTVVAAPAPADGLPGSSWPLEL